MQFLLLISGIGFVVALIISWAYELTPEGIKKEADVVHDGSIANITVKKLDYITLAAAVLILILMLYQQFNQPISNAESVDNTLLESSLVIDNNIKQSIAVLPFTNMANNAENEPFTLGLHDDLLTHLSRISALKVISRTSVMEYKNTTKKIKDIAAELGVTSILEGGVQRSGDQIRLNVQLIDAKTDEHLWAEIYDRELSAKNIFKIQTEISLKIAQALKAQLTPAETNSIEAIPTDNLQAYDAYLAARQLLETRKSAELKQALGLFQRASELDHNYALAYVGEAIALRLLTIYGDLSEAEMFTQGEPLITKALALNPVLAEAHTIKASYLRDKGKYIEAESSFKLSLSLNPNYASTYQWYGLLLSDNLGRHEEAIVLQRKAAELDPLSKVIMINLGYSLQADGQIQTALKHYQSVHELYPEYPLALTSLANTHIVLGNYVQAIISLEKAIALDPGNLRARANLSNAYLTIGDVTAANAQLKKSDKPNYQHRSYVFQKSLLELMQENHQAALQRLTAFLEEDPNNNIIKNNVAYFHIYTGDCKSALSLWRTAYPEKFASDYELGQGTVEYEIAIAWCLKQTGETQAANHLLEAVQLHIDTATNKVDQFSKAQLLAVQGKPAEAAKVYAEMVAAKDTYGWYWFDLEPYFLDMQKEPVFIEARAQLMQQLEQQRALLAEYRNENN